MKRNILLIAIIIYLLGGYCFADVPVTLKFAEDTESGTKSQYIPWPTWKPNAPQVLAAEYLVTLKDIKNELEKMNIAEAVTVELYTKTDRQLIAQLGSFTPGIIKNMPEVKSVDVAVKRLKGLEKYRDINDIPLDVPEILSMVIRNPGKEIINSMDVHCYLPLKEIKPEFKRIEKWVMKGEFEKAESFCEKLKEKDREDGYQALADAYVRNGQYEKAAQSYEKLGKRAKEKGYTMVGMAFWNKKDYKNAQHYFEKGGFSGQRARVYGLMADMYKEKGNIRKAKEFYDKAVSDYESMIKSIYLTWEDVDNNDRKRCMWERDAFEKDAEEIAQQKRLENILKKSARYCKKLLSVSFDFICDEVMEERIGNSFKNRLDYFYRLTKTGDKVKEHRSLMRQQGKRISRVEHSPDRQGYSIERIIFGPAAMLGRGWQNFFYYKILGEEVLYGEKTVILEALPKQHLPANPFFGKIWVKEDNGSVLKISWNPKSIEGVRQNFMNYISQRAKKYKGEPHILSVLELDVIKKGIRFPSKCYIEENYIGEDGKKVTRAKKTTSYKNYLFYSVRAQVKDEEMGEL